MPNKVKISQIYNTLSKTLFNQLEPISMIKKLTSNRQEKKNILIMSWRGPGHPQYGGAEIVTHQHAKAWVKSGYQVTLVTSIYKNGKKEEFLDGVKIIRLGSSNLNLQIIITPLTACWWYLFKNKDKYDLVFDHFHGWSFLTPLYIRTKKIGFIHEIAGGVWLHNPLHWPFNIIPALIGIYTEKIIFKLYKNIPFITVSKSTKKSLIDLGLPKKNINIINNGVLINKIKIKHKEKDPTLIFLGALSKDKGIEYALKVFASISKQDKNYQFWVVGKGEENYLTHVKKELSRDIPKDKLKYWGFVDEKKKFKLLAKAHLLINSSMKEGWGLVNIEANSVGTPVVGFNVPGVRDSVQHNSNGLLVKNGNTDRMSKVILELMNDSKDYQRLQKNAISWSQKFDWESSTKKSLNFIEQITR